MRAREHIAKRPGWQCTACGEEWPCCAAKAALADEYTGNPTALLVYLGILMWDAFDDGLGETGRVPIPPGLRSRFMDWAFPGTKSIKELSWPTR
jgi:hypothetical protein